VAQLRQLLSQKVAALAQGPRSDQVVVSRERHAAALRDGADSLQRASEILSAGEPLELVAADLRDAVYALDEITGPMTPDDVLGYIFSQFCIGK
jgi:tRNA modification GTPase